MAKKLFAGKETYAEELAEAKAVKSGKVSPQKYAREEVKEEKREKKEPSPKQKFGSGGMVSRGHGAAVKGFHFTKNG